MKKLLIATPLYPPSVGGPATYTKLLEEELPQRGIEPFVLSFDGVRHLPKGIRHIAYFGRVWKRSGGVDAILALDPVSTGLPACLAAWLRRKPLILKVVGDYAWEQYSQKAGARKRAFVDPEAFQHISGGPLTWLRKKTERTVAQRAERIIVPSAYLKKIVRAWKVPEDRIHIIYNAFDAPQIEESRQELRTMHDISDPMILSAGRLVPWKGFGALIEVMPDIASEFPSAKLYIAGSGPEKENLKTCAAKQNIEKHVVFLGSLDADMLHKYMKAADVFVLNTGYEGFSHTLLEAMSIGAPVISTEAGGNPELIDSGSDGLLVSFNNKAEILSAILEILRGQVDTDMLTQNARKKAEQFSRKKMLEETVTILNRV